MKKFFALFLGLLVASVALVSCEDEDDSNYFSGKEFTAYHGGYYWVLSMNGKGADGTFDGHFTIRAYDEDGHKVSGVEVYSGKYKADFEQSRIYIYWDGYSANSLWDIYEDSNEGWPNYDPNVVIHVPYSASGYFAGANFASGNFMKAPR